MYINNTTVTVNFVLSVTASPPAQSTYDLIVKTPSGVITYTDSDLLTYVAPTATTQGSATYAHLLDEEGRWEFSLTSGTDAAYTVLSKILIYSMTPVVAENTITVEKQATVANFVIPSIPLAPDTLVATMLSDTEINLTWVDNSNDEDNFVLQRSLTTGTGFATINSPAADAVAYSDTGLVGSTEYFYRIKASNGAGDSAYSSEDSATTDTAATGDVYYNDVVYLMSGEGVDEATAFVDEGPDARTITQHGVAKIDTGTDPYADGLGTLQQTASTDYLSTPYVLADFNWHNRDMTIEAWVYNSGANWNTWVNTTNSQPNMIGNLAPEAVINNWSFGPNTSGVPTLSYWNGSTAFLHNATTALSLSTWHHIAMTYNSHTGFVQIFVNGTSEFHAARDATGPTPVITYTLTLGRGDAQSLIGRVADLRITQYRRYTGNFSVPTARFPRTSDTEASGTDRYINRVSLLVAMDGADTSTTFTDDSYIGNTVTANGTADVATATDPHSDGLGVLDLPSSGSPYLSIPGDDRFIRFEDQDFTIECYVYATSWSTWTTPTNGVSQMCGAQPAETVFQDWSFGPFSDGKVMFYYFNGAQQKLSTTTVLSTSTWYHIAMTYTADSNAIEIFIDGVSSATSTLSGTVTHTASQPFVIGRCNAGSCFGKIADLRITTGVNRYPATFTPPSARLPIV